MRIQYFPQAIPRTPYRLHSLFPMADPSSVSIPGSFNPFAGISWDNTLGALLIGGLVSAVYVLLPSLGHSTNLNRTVDSSV